MRRRPRIVLPCLALSAIVGCARDDPLDRQPVSGTVTLDGEPLDGGSMMLEPISDGAGTAVGARIRQGRFSIPWGEGPVPGTYKVRIYASSRIQAPAHPGASANKPRPMVERIPEQYNSRTRLEATVVSGRSNVLKYDLLSAGPHR